MKKVTFSIVLVIGLVLAGCRTNPTALIQDPQGNFGSDSASIELCVTPLSADNKYQLSSVIEQNEMASSRWQALDFVSIAKDYVNSAEANEEFVAYYRNSDRVDAYPILGTYLEPTGSAVYLFYQREEPYAVAKLSLDSAGNIAETPVCRDMTNPPKVVDAQSIEDCYLSIVQCFSEIPDFDVMGIVLPSEGYPATYPIGKQSGEATIKYMAGEAKNFDLVDPFETLKDGYNAFSKHLTERKQILSQITIYPWMKHSFYETGYIRQYKNTLLLKDMPWYMEKYDSLVAVPLLSSDLEENVYILHLLYYHNQLIAEIVIERKNEGEIYSYSVVWENVGVKDETGEYTPIETSQYVKSLNSAAAHRAAWESQGVVYDNGKLIPVGVCEGKLVAFDCITNAVDVYK